MIKYFIITIDTEGDNLWSKPQNITTKNADFLLRFQELCNRFNFIPVWLTNFEMAKDERYVEFAKHFYECDQCEIGMHLHAWNNPPKYNLTSNDNYFRPYLIEYPLQVIKRKVDFLTKLLQDTFSKPITSHRAGRWSINDQYLQILSSQGYIVDSSVTPGIDWSKDCGKPNEKGGTNYKNYNPKANLIELYNDTNAILEVPMSTFNQIRLINWNLTYTKFLPSILLKSILFRPDGKNYKRLFEYSNFYKNNNDDYLMYMLHSSELMPGGSPSFTNKIAIEKLYQETEELFLFISQFATGISLSDFAIKKMSIL
jgi:hypothetical protein